MTFPAAVVKTPTTIGRIHHVVTDNDGAPGTVRFFYEVLDQFGVLMGMVEGDEVPHMDAGQISAVQAFAAAQRVKAESTLP